LDGGKVTGGNYLQQITNGHVPSGRLAVLVLTIALYAVGYWLLARAKDQRSLGGDFFDRRGTPFSIRNCLEHLGQVRSAGVSTRCLDT